MYQFPTRGPQPIPHNGVPLIGQPRQPSPEEMRQIMTAQEMQAMDQSYKQMVCNMTAGMAMEHFKANPNEFIDNHAAKYFADAAHNIATAAIQMAWGKHDDDSVPGPGSPQDAG